MFTQSETLKAPFPWFGGKTSVANEVWRRLGDVPNYVEPFFGSGAVMLRRPHEPKIETINDKDGFLSNFWRAVQHDPEAVACYADWPVNENDLNARHSWLVREGPPIVSRLEGDPDFYDAKIAGWWVWGLCSWIGSGWCSGVGPWHSVDGELVSTRNDGAGTRRQLPHLIWGKGINRKRPHLTRGQGITEWFTALSERLRRVRVCCGDWKRVCGPSPTVKIGITGVFLDPPYAHSERKDGLYRVEMAVADEVREWAIEHGNNPKLRIALCGYDGEHDMPGWDCYEWNTHGGYGVQSSGRGRANAKRERIWFSPHCLNACPGLVF